MSGCRYDACLGLCCNDLRDRLDALEEKISEKYAHPDVISRLERLEDRYEGFAKYQHPRLLQARIDKLESGDAFDYDERIEALEEVSAEKRLLGLESWSIKVNERLNDLEGYMKMEDRVTASSILTRIDSIQKSIDDINHCFGNVIKQKKVFHISKPAKTQLPHKCPVCEGCGSYAYYYTDQSAPTIKACNSCEGKGTVWG